MFCTKCGAKLPDEATCCPNCQAKVEKVLDFSEATKAVGQQVNKTVENVKSKTKSFQASYQKEQDDRKIKDVSELFIRPDEEQKAVIGGGYLANMFRTGVLSKGFGILTNRRFYFKGKCFYRSGKHFMKTDEERTVDLQDITSSGFTYTRHILWFAVGVLGLLWSLFGTIASYGNENVFLLFIVIGWIPDIVVWLIYVFFKRAIYEISFAGGGIAIKASAYGIKEIKAFDKKLRRAKDDYVGKDGK